MNSNASIPPGPPAPAMPIGFSPLLLNGGKVNGGLPLNCDCRSLINCAQTLAYLSGLKKLNIGQAISSDFARLSIAAAQALTVPPNDNPQSVIRVGSTLGKVLAYDRISVFVSSPKKTITQIFVSYQIGLQFASRDRFRFSGNRHSPPRCVDRIGVRYIQQLGKFLRYPAKATLWRSWTDSGLAFATIKNLFPSCLTLHTPGVMIIAGALPPTGKSHPRIFVPSRVLHSNFW